MNRYVFVSCVSALWVLLATPVSAVTRDTRFDPSRHGFKFANTFSNDVVPAVDYRTDGLCGGMTYAALDYFVKRKSIPGQDYRPANGTRLQRYLYDRQVASTIPNATKWAELSVNPDGLRNKEFFSWGLTSELKNLESRMASGRPVPIGVKGVNGSNHVVLAIGYRTGTRHSDLRIYVYDPNFPNLKFEMRPNLAGRYFSYTANGREIKWRTYFVDKSYGIKDPPSIPTPSYPNDGKVRELVVHFHTGPDDLRGGRDNVNMIINLRGGRRVIQNNVNGSARFLSNYLESVSVKLPSPIAKSDIASIQFTTTFGGGLSGDNWDVTKIEVDNYEGSARRLLTEHNRHMRFTGSRRTLTVPVHPGAGGKVTHLQLEIQTGSDDLRGGSDNVDATIFYRDGRKQVVRSINGRQRWADNTTRWVKLRLATPVELRDVVGVMLQITSRGGVGGDNWNMNKLVATPWAESSPLPLYFARSGAPVFRFTGDRRSYTARW